MGSLDIQIMRNDYPGKSDYEAAEAFAQKHGYIAIIRYKSSSSSIDFTNIGTCQTENDIYGYLNSQYCCNAEVIYDGRATAIRITEADILRGCCDLCGRQTTKESLHLMCGNDFYICPSCCLMFCNDCYSRLPLTSSPGYGMCPKCHIAVQRAIIGFYGNHSRATRWIRLGKTYEEKDAEYAAKLGPNVKLTRVISWTDFIKDNEVGTFTVCVLKGESHLIARAVVLENDIKILSDKIKTGHIILRTSFYPYPTFPVIYNRVFIIVSNEPKTNNLKGILLESLTNFAEANFQQWAITLRGTKRLFLHVYNKTNDELACGEVEIDPEVTDMVINAIDKANEYFKSIPEEKHNFKEAAQSFFQNYPEPFLFSNK